VTLVGVCHFLYLIILVPYNLFGLFLVHKISAYKYIYENGEKKWEKKKKKEFPASWAGGNFGPARRGARAREGAGPVAAQGRGRRRGRAGATASLRAHTSARAEGGTAPRFDGAGEPVVCGEENPTAGGPVLGPRGGGLARAGAGDPRGRLNLARGGREGAVRGEVAELHDGDRRRWSLGEGLGRGSGALSSRHCEEAARLT
jgi:hypothetical protein